ncbi:MAG: vWA domain-containing protein, partial [Aquihabitans sp.]
MSTVRGRSSGRRGRARGARTRRWGLGTAVAVLVLAGLAPLASSTPATDGNPDLPSVCGRDVTRVLDDYRSISSSEADQVRTAASTFASALDGTPSRLKVAVFESRATGVNSGGTSTSTLGNIVFRDPSAYSSPTSGAGSGGTNWDDGLEVARRSNGGPGDLVVFITDGDPTYRNTTQPDGHSDAGNHSLSGNGNDVSTANVDAAVTEADAIKAGGAHMFGIGVGLSAADSKQRLNDVTGDEELTLDGSGNPNIPFGTADFTIAPNFTSLQTIVKSFVRELCAPSLNVTKFLQKADGTTVQAGAGDPFTFNASLAASPTSWQSPPGATGASASQATDASGGASFKWKTQANSTTVNLSETAKPGWVYNGALCTRNKLDGTTPAVIFNSVGTNAPNASKDQSELQGLVVGVNEAVNCDVYNRQVRTATIQVAKQTVPAGLSDTFDFTLKDGGSTIDTKTGIAHGGTATFTPVQPGTYAVSEAANTGFTQTSATCDDLGTQAAETVSPGQLTVGEGQSWKCSFVNTAKPGTLTVVKNAVGANGTFSFTSNVPDLGNFDLTTAGGTASTAVVAAPVGTYNIAEGSPSPWQLTGATCTGGQSPSSVFVGPGKDVVCTFTNTAPAPTIQVTKTAGVPSVAEPGGSVTYTVTVANTSVEPVEITSLTDSVEGGPSFPITSVSGPVTSTSCGSLIGTSLTPTGLGSSAQCTFAVPVTGDGGDTVGDVVTAKAEDS